MLVLSPEVDLLPHIGQPNERTDWVIMPHPTDAGHYLLVRKSEANQIKHSSPGLFPNLHSLQTIGVKPLSAGLPEWSSERPTLSAYYRGDLQLPAWVAADSLVQKYLDLFGPLDWDNFPERDDSRSYPGVDPLPRRVFAASFLIKIHEGRRYMSDLRKYLVDHPSLVWLLGFDLQYDELASYGFDVDKSLPSHRHFSRVLRTFNNESLKFLFGDSIRLIDDELPEDVNFAELVAGDTKHIIAWVRENNPKDIVADRYNPKRQPTGDPDCKLGVKRSKNQGGKKQATEADLVPNTVPVDSIPVVGANGSIATPTKQGVPVSGKKVKPGKEYYWGYGTGVIATKVPEWGEFVLAEHTKTFNESDISYFYPLMDEVEQHLGRKPKNGAFDAAFDAHYTQQYFADSGGFGAIPRANRGPHRQFDDDGLPLCEAGLAMPMKGSFMNRTSRIIHRRGRYVCPLLFPEATGEVCPIDHAKWPKGGCILTMPTDEGSRIRYQLDRESEEYKKAYNQRTATERINSLACQLGIERPMLRHQMSITNQNTLIYLLLNLRALQRIKAKKLQLAA